VCLAVIIQGTEGGRDTFGVPSPEDGFVGLALSEKLLDELEAEAGGAPGCESVLAILDMV